MLHPDARRFLAMMARAGLVAGASADDPARRRQSLRQLAELAGGAPFPEIEVEPLAYINTAAPEERASRLDLRLYRPPSGRETDGLILYVHGGGWVAGDLDTHDGVCRTLAGSSGCKVLAVDYRRPPESPFPAAVLDIADVALWCLDQASTLGFAPDKLVLAGDSAGGNIVTGAVSLLGATVPIRLLLLLCPILDQLAEQPSRQAFADGYFLSSDQWTRDQADYIGDPAQALDPLSSPMHIEDLSGFPPVALHLAEFDPFRDEGLAFADRLKTAGVAATATVHEGMIHYFYALPRVLSPARPILEGIGAEVARALA